MLNINSTKNNFNNQEELNDMVFVNKKELKKVMCYEVEKSGQKYIFNVIATKNIDKIKCEVIVSKENEPRACTWDRITQSKDNLNFTNYNVEGCADYIVDTYAYEIIDFFEEKTDCMYSYDRVKRDMKFWAKECSKEGFNLMYSHFISQMNHITNSEELSEISEFVYSLEGVTDPIKYYEEYIAE